MAKHPGRPAGETPRTVLTHAHKTAPQPFLPPEDQDPKLYQATTEPLCPVCTQLLDRPLQLACGTIICLNCCSSWIQFHNPPLCCLCCYEKLCPSTATSSNVPCGRHLGVLCEGVWENSKGRSVQRTPQRGMPEPLPPADQLTNQTDHQ